MEELSNVKALMFDLFGTILDLGGSLTPFIARSVLGAVAGAAAH